MSKMDLDPARRAWRHVAFAAALFIFLASFFACAGSADEIDVNSAKYRDDAARVVLPGHLPFALTKESLATSGTLQIRRVCAHGQQIIALASDSVIHFDLSNDSAYSETFPFHIVDIDCADPAHMRVLASSWPERRIYAIAMKTDDPWSGWRRGNPLALFTDERPLGYVTGDSEVRVLTTQRLLTLRGDRMVSETKLSRRIDVFALARSAIVLVGDDIYFGNDGGEWGGTLYRIDRATGTVSFVQAGAPVVAIVADPGHAGCVLVARGLVHMMLADGALERVCHATMQVLAEKEPIWAVAGKNPIFVGFSNGIGELKDDAIVNRRAYATSSRAVAGLPYADLPGVMLLRTGVSQSVSVSGPTPLLVAWEGPAGDAASR